MMIPAAKWWPSVVNTYLWPYALRMANDLFNATPSLRQPKTPINAFSRYKVTINPKHWYPFGCPVYVLDSDLQTGKKIEKWSDRARMGIYLGMSPQHARMVALVLSLQSGLVSPQFHVRMDPTFQTLRTVYGGQPPKSQWQCKCHFVRDEQ